jgi:hypothetical protein
LPQNQVTGSRQRDGLDILLIWSNWQNKSNAGISYVIMLWKMPSQCGFFRLVVSSLAFHYVADLNRSSWTFTVVKNGSTFLFSTEHPYSQFAGYPSGWVKDASGRKLYWLWTAIVWKAKRKPLVCEGSDQIPPHSLTFWNQSSMPDSLFNLSWNRPHLRMLNQVTRSYRIANAVLPFLIVKAQKYISILVCEFSGFPQHLSSHTSECEQNRPHCRP